MATQTQYFNAMLDTNNEVRLNDFYPYIINYQSANPAYNKSSFEEEYNTKIWDNFTTQTTEKSEDMVYALRKRLWFDRMNFYAREVDPSYDPDTPDLYNQDECIQWIAPCPGYRLVDATHIFDRPTYNCETWEYEMPEVENRIDALAEVTDHVRWDGSLHVMVRWSDWYNRMIFKQCWHQATNACNELIDPDPCSWTFVLISQQTCEHWWREYESLWYSDDPCIYDKFTKFMWPKWEQKAEFSWKVQYINQEWVEWWYIPCNGSVQAGDVIFLNWEWPLSWQRATSTWTQSTVWWVTYCEVSELLGGGTLSESWELPGNYVFQAYENIWEILWITTWNWLEYITETSCCPNWIESIKDPTFYEKTCPTLSPDKKWKITWMAVTPRWWLAIKHIDSPYVIYGQDWATGFSYFQNVQYVWWDYTHIENIFDHLVMLGYDKIWAVSPVYDGNGNMSGTRHIPIDMSVGYYWRDSYDFWTNSLTMFTNYKYFIRYTFSIWYNNQLTVEPDRFFKFDSIVTRISKKHWDEVSVMNNWGNTIVSIMNENNTIMMLRDQKHQHDYLRMICGGRIKWIRDHVRFGNGIFCRNCEKKDFGKHFKTYIRAKHGQRSLYSMKILNKIKLCLGSHSWLAKWKNIFSMYLDAGWEKRERHTDDFYNTSRGSALMKIKWRQKKDDDNHENLYSVQGTGRCIRQWQWWMLNCEWDEMTNDFIRRFCCFDPIEQCCSKYKAQSEISRFGVIELPISKWYSYMTRTLTTKDEAEFEFLWSERSFNYPSTELTKISNVMWVKSVNQRWKWRLVTKKENTDRVVI
jgi:hypothetical protein